MLKNRFYVNFEVNEIQLIDRHNEGQVYANLATLIDGVFIFRSTAWDTANVARSAGLEISGGVLQTQIRF